MSSATLFQRQVTTARFSLPVATALAALFWLVGFLVLPERQPVGSSYGLWRWFEGLAVPAWADCLGAFCLYLLAGYFLVGVNNVFAIIRLRASAQTMVYLLLVAACPMVQTLYAGSVSMVLLLFSLYFLFRSYQHPRASAELFYSFAFLGAGSLLLPQLLLFLPLSWLGAYLFQSLNLRSFFASLVGLSFPFWFLAGHAFYYGQMELFYAPFRELVRFDAVDFAFRPWEVATLTYVFVLFAVSAVFCLFPGYSEKLRTRNYLHFFIVYHFCLFVYVLLQPAMFVPLLPLLLVGISFLSGRLFLLTGSRVSNVFFIVMFVGLFLLFGFNLWTLL